MDGDTSERSSAELVRRAGAGDRAAWEALVARYGSALWSVARAVGLSETDAADVVATAWLRLVEHLPRLRAPERVGAWLLTTARNEGLRVRAANRRLRPAEHAVLDRADECGPETFALASEADRTLLHELDRLPRSCRILLRLYLHEPDLPADAIAEAAELPREHLAHHRRRCLDRLRRRLEEPR